MTTVQPRHRPLLSRALWATGQNTDTVTSSILCCTADMYVQHVQECVVNA